MTRPVRARCRAPALAIAIFLLGSAPGCQRQGAPPGKGPPTAVAPPAQVPAPPAAAAAHEAPKDPKDALAKSYNDPRIVDALARDCAWDPTQDPERARLYKVEGEGDAVDPLLCELEFDQSCSYDPCYETEQEKCEPRCTAACTSCKTTCKSSCETCKKGCADAACQKTCAVSCAACQQACVQTRDRCATGACAEEYKTCRKNLKQGWKRNHCAKFCPSYMRCQMKCTEENKEKEKYWEICEKKCAPLNKACNPRLCPNQVAIDPESDD